MQDCMANSPQFITGLKTRVSLSNLQKAVYNEKYQWGDSDE